MAERNRKRITTAILPANMGPADRRDRSRSQCASTCAFTIVSLQQQPPRWSAKVRDISASGIGLLVNRAMQPGTFLAIHFNSHFSRALCARVVHSTLRRSEMAWVVGCTLSRPLSAAELETLT